MLTKNGYIQCPKGGEIYETYTSHLDGKEYVQYRFRTVTGKLFAFTAHTLEQAREAKEKWLLKH
jgi:hypothetical protein